jgi:hypothetical protein
MRFACDGRDRNASRRVGEMETLANIHCRIGAFTTRVHTALYRDYAKAAVCELC